MGSICDVLLKSQCSRWLGTTSMNVDCFALWPMQRETGAPTAAGISSAPSAFTVPQPVLRIVDAAAVDYPSGYKSDADSPQ